MKYLLSLLTCLTLLLLPAAAVGAADETVEAFVYCNIAGAEIYVDEEFSGLVTVDSYDKNNYGQAVSLQVSTEQEITVRLPGYTVDSYPNQSNPGVTAMLSPELYPPEYENNVQKIQVGRNAQWGQRTIIEALNTVKNRGANNDTWYVIYINDASGLSFGNLLSGDFSNAGLTEKYHHFTIVDYTDHNVPFYVFKMLMISANNARFVGLDFCPSSPSTADDASLRLRTNSTSEGDNAEIKDDPIHADNVYFIGCSFSGLKECGVANCGERGMPATEYDGDGTYNVKNLCYSNCTFDGVDLFSFAASGDEDYNVIDGFNICANTFINCGVGMLAANAHSWSTYSYDGQDAPAISEHNILKNVLISSNSFNMTAGSAYAADSIISVGCARQGNQNNLVENVVIRSNTVTLNGEAANRYSALSLFNVAVADYSGSGTGLPDYAAHIPPGLTHTDGNIMRNIEVYNNDFQGGVSVHNVLAGGGGQCGQNNHMSDINIHDNIIVAPDGLRVSNYAGSPDSGECDNNTLTNVSVSNNKLTRGSGDGPDLGLLLAAGYISQPGENTVAYPAYSGSMSDISVSNNSVSGYGYGIMAAACAGDYGQGMSLERVEITGNSVTTANWHEYPIIDIGVAVAANGYLTNYDNAATAPRPGQNGLLSQVRVEDNTITARTGVATCGLLADSSIAYPASGNRVRQVSVSSNDLYLRQRTEYDSQKSVGIVSADVIELGDKLSAQGHDRTDMIGGNRLANVTVSENSYNNDPISTDDFTTDEALYGASLQTQAAALEAAGWSWIKQSGDDSAGVPFDRNVNGEYAAKRQLNGLWLYQTYSVDGDSSQAVQLALSHTQDSNVYVVDWSAAGALRCLLALYDANGRMVSISQQSVAANAPAAPLRFPIPSAKIAAATSGKLFVLGAADDLAPLIPVVPFRP